MSAIAIDWFMINVRWEVFRYILVDNNTSCMSTLCLDGPLGGWSECHREKQ